MNLPFSRFSGIFAAISAVLVLGPGAGACSGTSAGIGLYTCDDGGCPSTDPSNGGSSEGGAGTRPGQTENTFPDAQASTGDAAASFDASASTGGPCERDIECDTGLCNLKLEQCTVPGPNGAACERDSECAASLCNLRTETCEPKQASGRDCERDTECASGLCNLALETCK